MKLDLSTSLVELARSLAAVRRGDLLARSRLLPDLGDLVIECIFFVNRLAAVSADERCRASFAHRDG